VLVLYGRSGVLKTKRAQTILPWLSPVRRSPSRSAGSGRMATASTSTAIPRSASRIPGAFLVRGNRLFWFLTILAATAVAALIIGRTLIMSGRGTTLSPWENNLHFAHVTPRPISSRTKDLLMMPFAFFQNLGMTELMIVAFVSLLIFGNRLPSVMRSLGKSVTEFKKGVSGIEDDIDQAGTQDKKRENDQAVTADRKRD
jgi:sec-independent protein translocase protein TatA